MAIRRKKSGLFRKLIKTNINYILKTTRFELYYLALIQVGQNLWNKYQGRVSNKLRPFSLLNHTETSSAYMWVLITIESVL